MVRNNTKIIAVFVYALALALFLSLGLMEGFGDNRHSMMLV